MWKCISSSPRIRASKDYFCALWGNTYFRLLNDLTASHYCLEFPVCMYAHSLEQEHLFLSTRKTVVTAPTLRQFAVGHVMRCKHCTKEHLCLRIHRQGAKCCSAHSFAWLTSQRGEWHHGDTERQGQPRLGGKHTLSLQSTITYLWELCGRAKLEELSAKCQQSPRDTDLHDGAE